MAKSCNGTKSFKQRNPDLNLDEIQKNPNIPDEVKAVLNESALKLADDVDENVERLEEVEEYEPADLKTTSEILAYIDDGEYFLRVFCFNFYYLRKVQTNT